MSYPSMNLALYLEEAKLSSIQNYVAYPPCRTSSGSITHVVNIILPLLNALLSSSLVTENKL